MDKLTFNHFILLFLIITIHSFFMVLHGTEASSLSCHHTPYPHVCNHYMTSTNTLSTSSSSSSFHDMALRVTLDQAIEAHKLVSTMKTNNQYFKDDRARQAWTDCLELYEDTVHQLNRSVMSSTNLNDKLTWLSASIANHQTCQNGFLDFNLHEHLNFFPNMLTNFSKLISNSLAITNAMATSSSQIIDDNNNGSRKLLMSDGLSFPGWVSGSDRRLLTGLVGPRVDVVVAKDGSGNYKTIMEGVEAASKMGGGRRVVVHVKGGVYEENVVIKRGMRNLMIVGDGIGVTIVSGSKNAQHTTTLDSATFAVSGDNFMARDITFENTAGPEAHQAVALLSCADHSVFFRCSFKGYQDTLYLLSQRQFYRDCDIYGTIDFIFGDAVAVAVLQNCNIFVRKPMSNQQNAVTAQGRSDPNENTGIILHGCRITASSELRPVQGNFKTFLGRPWKEYSRTVVLKSNLDGGLIHPAGWMPWSGSFALKTLYYGEFMNSGGGAATGGRVKWPGFHVITSLAEAGKFTVGNFLAGGSWIAGTGVPFQAGL